MHRLATFLLIAAAIMAGTSQAAVLTKSLQAFSGIKVCTPFNVLIQPSSGNGQYQVLLDADSAVQQALQASVSGNVLSLGASGRFKTSNPIKLTVRLPASALKEVDVAAPVGIQVVVNGSFSPASFTASNSGVSDLRISGASAQSASLQNTGTGSIVWRGSLGSATVLNSGTGTVYVSGVQKSVSVNLSGVGSVVVDAASDSTAITGQAQGLTKVQYNRGTCSIESTFGMRAQSTFGPFFPSPCMQTPVSIPSVGVEWTCGLQLDGTFNCTVASGTIISGDSTTVISGTPGASGGSTQTFSRGGGGSFSSQTSSTGGGSAYASSSSSSGPNVQSTFVNNVFGGLRSGQTIAGSAPCSVSAQARMMVPNT